MQQFAVIVNKLNSEGAKHFAGIIKKASAEDTTRLESWMRGSPPAVIDEAGAMLNQGRIADFRNLSGLKGVVGSPQSMTTGCAGFVLVLMRLLQLAGMAASDVGDVFWFISSIGILASFVGLIISLVAIVSGSGRLWGVAGIVLYGLLAAMFVFI